MEAATRSRRQAVTCGEVVRSGAGLRGGASASSVGRRRGVHGSSPHQPSMACRVPGTMGVMQARHEADRAWRTAVAVACGRTGCAGAVCHRFADLPRMDNQAPSPSDGWDLVRHQSQVATCPKAFGWMRTRKDIDCAAGSVSPTVMMKPFISISRIPSHRETPYSARSTARSVPRFWSRHGMDAQIYSITWNA